MFGKIVLMKPKKVILNYLNLSVDSLLLQSCVYIEDPESDYASICQPVFQALMDCSLAHPEYFNEEKMIGKKKGEQEIDGDENKEEDRNSDKVDNSEKDGDEVSDKIESIELTHEEK